MFLPSLQNQIKQNYTANELAQQEQFEFYAGDLTSLCSVPFFTSQIIPAERDNMGRTVVSEV